MGANLATRAGISSLPLNCTIALLGPIETAAFQDLLPPPGTHPYPPGLGGSPLNLLARELLRRGYKVALFSLDPAVQNQLTIEGEGLTIHYGPFRRKRARDFFSLEITWLINTVLSQRPDFLHAHWTYEYALAAQATGLPHLITAHDAPFNVLKYNFIPYRIARTLMACKAIRKAEHLSAVAPYVADHLKRYLFYRKTIRIIPNGMPELIFNRIKTVKKVDAPIVFATVLSHWSRLKNSEGAVQAFALLREQLPHSRMIMFGSGHGPNDPGAQWARSRRLDGGIEFAGPLPHNQLIDRLCNEVDILVHPAVEEAQPMSVIEAMAAGIPVVAGKYSGGVPWTLDHGTAGVLVDVTHHGQLAEAMLNLAKDANKREQVGQAGSALARHRFHIATVTDGYLEAYRDILAGNWL